MKSLSEQVSFFLKERAEKMEAEIFSAPPADYATFRERLGAWSENKYMQDVLADILRGIEKDY